MVLLGIAMLLALFIGLFICIAYSDGFAVALGVFATGAFLVVWVAVAAHLLQAAL